MRIPNRLAALLIVIVFAVAIGVGIYWLFSYNTGTLIVTTEPIGATVTLERERVPLYERLADPTATFADIPAFEYTLSVTASGYASERKTVTVKKEETTELGVRLLPQAYFEEVTGASEPIEEAVTDTDTATGATGSMSGETTDSMTEETATGSGQAVTDETPTESASDSEYIVHTKPVLEILTKSGTLLYTHPRPAENVAAHDEEGFISFSEGDIPYVYDTEYDRAVPIIGWSEPIVSVRRTPDRDRWIIHSDKSTATYSIRDNSLLPHPFFSDYIYLDADSMLGIIDNADIARWNRLGEKSPGRDAVVLLDLTTKSYRIVSSDHDDLMRIEFSLGVPMVYDSHGGRFIVRNFR